MTSLIAGDLLLGRYRLDVPLGRGGAGVVWRARDTKLGRPVAIKALPKRSRSTAAVVAEARTIASVSNPHIVALHELAEDEHHFYLVTEVVDGTNLEAVANADLLTAQEAAAVLTPAVGALAAAHRVGVVHGDVKPANVLLGRSGEVKLADFGAAAFAKTSGKRSGSIEVSPAYAAPEILGGGEPTVASDLYGLGATLARVLGARGAQGTLSREVPPTMRTLVARLVADDPRDRPERAEDVLDDLEIIGAGLDRRVLVKHLADAHAVVEPVEEPPGAAKTRPPVWTEALLARLWPATVLGLVAWASSAAILGSPWWALMPCLLVTAVAVAWPWVAGAIALLLAAGAIAKSQPVWGIVFAVIGGPLWMIAARTRAREVLAAALAPAFALVGAPLASAAVLAKTLGTLPAVLAATAGALLVPAMVAAGFTGQAGWLLPGTSAGQGPSLTSLGRAYTAVPLLVESALIPLATLLLAAARKGPRWLGPVAMAGVVVGGFAVMELAAAPARWPSSAAYADLSLSLIIGALVMAAAPTPGERPPERR